MKRFETFCLPCCIQSNSYCSSPLPGIVDIVAYRNLRLYVNPIAKQRSSIETELEMAKRLVLGTLVSVAGTRMLIQLYEENMELNLYISGGLLIVSLTFYTVFARKGWGGH